MTKHSLIAVATCATIRLFALDVHQHFGNVVGYQDSCISQGVSRITINADSLDIFPTLGDVVVFEPPEAIVGDEIMFLLDGRWQTYRFISYDGTNAVLTTNHDPLPKHITLNGTPFSIHTSSTTRTAKSFPSNHLAAFHHVMPEKLDSRPLCHPTVSRSSTKAQTTT